MGEALPHDTSSALDTLTQFKSKTILFELGKCVEWGGEKLTKTSSRHFLRNHTILQLKSKMEGEKLGISPETTTKTASRHYLRN
mmetsp:Transcript_19602/g.35314  ORF Transcript_19602/g.35314 Transcript_19602/m.35314 type:complete len:84 (+) Transcript_19602:765-1016(+)